MKRSEMLVGGISLLDESPIAKELIPFPTPNYPID
jgi:hypothetical protein